MISKEQIGAWRESLRNPTKEVIYAGTNKEYDVTSTEKIRYEAHDRFAKAIMNGLRWIIALPESVSRPEVEERLQTIRDELSDVQQALWEPIEQAILREYDQVHQEGGIERIQQLVREACAFVMQEGIFKASFEEVGATIEVTPLGAVVVTVATEEHFRKFAIGQHSSGFKMRMSSQEGDDPEVLRVINRMIMVQGNNPSALLIRDHELFHDLYHLVGGMREQIDYPDVRADYFLKLKNEIIAYLISEEFQYFIYNLLSTHDLPRKSEEAFNMVRAQMAQELADEHEGPNKMQYGRQRSYAFWGFYMRVAGELFRLRNTHSTNFDQALQAVIGSTNMRELAYKLSRIESPPLDLLQPEILFNPNRKQDALQICLWRSLDFLTPVQNLEVAMEKCRRRRMEIITFEERIEREEEELHEIEQCLIIGEKYKDRFIQAESK